MGSSWSDTSYKHSLGVHPTRIADASLVVVFNLQALWFLLQLHGEPSPSRSTVSTFNCFSLPYFYVKSFSHLAEVTKPRNRVPGIEVDEIRFGDAVDLISELKWEIYFNFMWRIFHCLNGLAKKKTDNYFCIHCKGPFISYVLFFLFQFTIHHITACK